MSNTKQTLMTGPPFGILNSQHLSSTWTHERSCANIQELLNLCHLRSIIYFQCILYIHTSQSTLIIEFDYPQLYIEVNTIEFSRYSMKKNACTSTNVFIVFEAVTRSFTSIPAVFESRHFRLRVFAQRLISRWWPWTWYLGFSTTHCRAHVPQPLGCEPKQGGPESEIWCWVDDMRVGFGGFWFVWSVLLEKAPILYKSGSRQWMIYQSNEWRH